jgi:hypothetical protein
MKNILTLAAVGEHYIKSAQTHLHKFKLADWDIHILTDAPEEFPEFKTYLYTNTVFSYFDKLLFSFRVLKEQKKGVVCLDADKLFLISDKFINTQHDYPEFRYYSINRWAPYFSHLQDNGVWSIIYRYFKYLDMETDNIKNIWEEVFYFPYNIFQNRQINIDIETLKPIFEYRSIIDGWSRPSLGEGEGIAIGFLIEKYGLDHLRFECEVFPNNNPFDGKENLL